MLYPINPPKPQKRTLPLRRNFRKLHPIRLINLTPQTRCSISPPAHHKSPIPASTNCPTAALNPAKKELKRYPPVKHAYTNCTAPTYIKNTRNASMMSNELGVLARYDFQRSVVAVERREREREGDEDGE